MKKVFLITDDPALRDVFERCASPLGARVQVTNGWAAAREALFKDRFDALFVDYDAMKIEGLDAFILLDNVLQKEQTCGVLILRRSSARARQFIDSLDSFARSVDLNDRAPSVELLAGPLKEALAASPADPSQTLEGGDTLGPVRVQVHLSTRPAGSLGQIGLSRALYTLALAGSTGILSLSHGHLKHRYAIYEGEPRVLSERGFSGLDTLAGAFAWSDGAFEFTRADIPSGPTQKPLNFIYQAICRHLPARTIMADMMAQMRAYPTPTKLWEQRREALQDAEILQRLMAACDGNTLFEQALASLGADATRGFQAAFFATQTDLMMLRPQPTPQGIEVEYNREIALIQQEQVEAQKKTTKAYRALGTGRVSLERELARFLSRLERATPYEIFGVWEGCGRAVVQSKFYELVKQHHPDVYGGNISGDVKRLAQDIFIALKDTHQELLKIEREQTCPPPEATATSALGDEPSFGARPAPAGQAAAPGQPADSRRPGPAAPETASAAESDAEKNARRSRIERLRVKRAATPIGLGREPSAPIIESKARRRRTTQSSQEREARIARIRSNSNPGKASSTGSINAAQTAQNAFNEGYTAWRENDNIHLAAQRFATAYNLEPGNGKYMTFYGYFLFLQDASLREDAQRILEKAIELKDRQSLPDAYVFMGHLLKVQGKHRQALKSYRHALKLNPASRDAQREIRLYEKRNKTAGESEGATFLKNLFKK